MNKKHILSTTILAALATTASTKGANLLWTTGGDNSGTWDASFFNTQSYLTPPDMFTIDGTATKLITLAGAMNATSLTISATGVANTTAIGSAGAGAVTLSGTPLGGLLFKTGSADLVLATDNTFGAVNISSGKFFLNTAAGLGTTGTLTVAAGTNVLLASASVTAANAGNFFYDSTNLLSSYTFSKNIAFTTTATATYGLVVKGGSGYTATFSGNLSGGPSTVFRADTSVSGDSTTTYAFTGDNSAFVGTLYDNRGRFLFNSTASAGGGGLSLTTNSSPIGNIAFTNNVVLVNPITFGSSGHTVNAAAGQTDVLAGTIGTLGFTKIGTGRLVLLSPLNSASIQDTVSDGTLSVAGAGRLNSGSLAVTLTLSAATSVFDYASSANQTITSAGIKGLGSVTKTGAGTLTLSGTNTYSGSTTLANGSTVLAFGGATTPTTNILPSASALILSGGALRLTGAGTQTINSVSVSSNSGSSLVLGAASETVTLGALNFAGTNSGLFVNTVAGGANATTSTLGTSTVVVPAGQVPGNLINAGFTVLDAGGYGLATVDAANNLVRLTTTPALPTDGSGTSTTDYRVAGATNTVPLSESANSITIDASAAVGTGTLAITAGQFLRSTTLNLGGTGTAPFNISGGSLTAATAGGALVINNYLTTGSGGITSVIANNTSASSVNINGPGITALMGANTYSGGTTLGTGAYLQISGSASALGTGPLTVNGNATFVSGVSTPTTPIVLNNGAVLTMNTGINGFYYNFGGVISGSGSIIANGSLRLSGANTFTGGITINTSTYFYPSGGDSAFGAVPTSFVQNNITMINGLISTSSSSANLTINANRGILLEGGTNNVGFQPNTYSITYPGVIAGSGALYRSSTGTGGIVLTGLNLYQGQSQLFSSGITTINTIKNVAGGASSLGAPGTAANGILNFGSTTTINPSTLAYVGLGNTTDRVINLAGSGNVTLDQSGTGPLVFTSSVTATGAGSKSLILQGSTVGTGELAGSIVDPSGFQTSVVKAGLGQWTLSGLSSYTGPTSVNGGTLNVNGNIATSVVTVSAGGTLGGGTTATPGILSALTVNSGGTVAPGTGTIGTLNAGTAASGITLSSDSTFALEINSTTGATDLLSVTGTLNLGMGTPTILTISDLGNASSVSNEFDFITYTNGYNGGLFSYNGTTVNNGDVITVGQNQYDLFYAGGPTGNAVTLVPVPEPNAALSLVGGLGILVGVRRLRRKG